MRDPWGQAVSDAHLTVIEDRLRTSQDYRAWRAAAAKPWLKSIPTPLHEAISQYGDARVALALTTAKGGLQSASRAQELVATYYQAITEEYTMLLLTLQQRMV